MDGKKFHRRKVTAFGIEHVNSRWWSEELAEHLGETVYVYRQRSPVIGEKAKLLVFNNELSQICGATLLHNPFRLLADVANHIEGQSDRDKGKPQTANEAISQALSRMRTREE